MQGSLFSLFIYVPVIVMLSTGLIATVIYRLMKELVHPDSEKTFVVTALLIIGVILTYATTIGTLAIWWLGWLG